MISLVSLGKQGSAFAEQLELYLRRLKPMTPVQHRVMTDEAAFHRWLAREGRIATLVTLLDSRGVQMTSEAFAEKIRSARDQGKRHLVFAVGPADGWSKQTLAEVPDALLSLGPMTLPHELALLVLAEQVYRAFTILNGHPYHSGH